MKIILKKLISFIAIFILVELMVRFWYSDRPALDSIVSDPELGWKLKPGYRFEGSCYDNYGISYSVEHAYNEDGFICFGDLSGKNRKRILFLGDGYTQARYLPNKYVYTNVLKNSFPVEIFVYAAENYGILQKYLVLEEWVRKIEPDILVIQAGFPDIVSSDPSYEASTYQSTYITRTNYRPYLNEKGDIEMKKPHEITFFLKFDFGSMALRVLNEKLFKLLYESNNIAYKNNGKNTDTIDYERAKKTFGEVLKKIRKILPEKTKIYMFSWSDEKPFYKDMQEIAARNNIYFISGVTNEAMIEIRKGRYMTVGSSWNAKCQFIVAETLAKHLRKEF